MIKLKPKKGFVQDQLNIELFTPLQWDGIMRAMDAYAKYIIEVNLCDDSPLDFNETTINQLKNMHKNVSELINWINE